MPRLLAAALMIAAFAMQARADPPAAALAKALHGLRPAGPPQDCIGLREADSTQIVDENIIVYRGTGRAYVNRPPGGCLGLKPDRALVTRTPSARLCRGDIATVLDPVSHTEWGSCALGDFEPYAR